ASLGSLGDADRGLDRMRAALLEFDRGVDHGLQRRQQRRLAAAVVGYHHERLTRPVASHPVLVADALDARGDLAQQRLADALAHGRCQPLQFTQAHEGHHVALRAAREPEAVELADQRGHGAQAGGGIVRGPPRQFALVGHAIADVFGQHQPRRATVELDAAAEYPRLELAAVAALMGPDAVGVRIPRPLAHRLEYLDV